MDVIGQYCEIMRAVLGTKDVPRQGGEGEQIWMGRGAEGEQLSLLGEVEDNSCNLRGGEQW